MSVFIKSLIIGSGFLLSSFAYSSDQSPSNKHLTDEVSESSVNQIDQRRATWFASQFSDQAGDIAYGSGPIGGGPIGGGPIGGGINSGGMNESFQPDVTTNSDEIRRTAEDLYFMATNLYHTLLRYDPWDRSGTSARQVYDSFSDVRYGWFRLQRVAPYWLIRNMSYTYNQLEDAIYSPYPNIPPIR